MSDDLDGLDDALEAQAASPLVAVVPASEFIADLERMAPLVDSLVAGFTAGRVFMDDPLQREQLVRLWQHIGHVTGVLSSAAIVVERAFLNAAVDSNAKQIPTPAGVVRYEAPRGEYVGDFASLRTTLRTMAASTGIPPISEVDDALIETRTVKPDHRKLNSLKDRYGGDVAEAIDAHRQFVTPPAVTGRVRFPKEENRPNG